MVGYQALNRSPDVRRRGLDGGDRQLFLAAREVVAQHAFRRIGFGEHFGPPDAVVSASVRSDP